MNTTDPPKYFDQLGTILRKGVGVAMRWAPRPDVAPVLRKSEKTMGAGAKTQNCSGISQRRRWLLNGVDSEFSDTQQWIAKGLVT